MSDKKHSNLGPSSAERWFNCPGSVALCEKAPPDKGSIYAAEGSVAHGLAEDLVTGKTDHLTLMGRIDEIVPYEGYEIEITEDMVNAVMEYDDEIKGDLKKFMEVPRPEPIICKSEMKVSASSIHEKLYGTSDYIMFRKKHKLVVYDFKYGRTVVEPDENKQMAIYLIAVMDTVAGLDFEELELVIIQPRADHIDGAVRRWVVPKLWLEEFQTDLMVAVENAQGEGSKLESGSWCRWCPAKIICPEMFSSVEKSAQADFSVVPAKNTLPDVGALPIEKLTKALAWEENIKSWFEAVKNRVREMLEEGKPVPGYKLVEGRSNRKWVSENAVIAVYEPVLGDNMFQKRKILSPAKLEKIVGKGKLQAGLTEKPPGAKAIALDRDPRPSTVSTVKDDFSPLAPALVKKVLIVPKADTKALAALEKELLGESVATVAPVWPQDEPSKK